MAPLGKDTRNPNGGGIRAKSGPLYQTRPAETNALVIGSRFSAVGLPEARGQSSLGLVYIDLPVSTLGMETLMICSQQ